ncbi:protein-glutamate methylesterase/protein-glutamine glutaminase [Salimicrobium halophilum]|uniref:Protein-glutamate methylesterase/protein-glutamine glutaminase n=1 Tax=Salimicrobium halophilum TaxID=86666 RepID=A0A1G8QAH5_9BACI|nr:chemotaxis response regulator protein-glutamate methylesterase [Salimicrobium halophilum]SDJ01475.1 two-component system, chemotaxis family, response regulator CheB [Salimicrobium halophilum]
MDRRSVLVVDDSAFMRKMIHDMIEEDPRLYVIATARNGEDALDKVERLDPDVITLDIEMPKMNGLIALEKIMQDFPRPVVMLSSLTQEGARSTVEALSIGAVDFVPKPSGAISLDINKVKRTLLQKVVAASRAKISKKVDASRDERIPSVSTSSSNSLVAIGTSTGGPRALQEVLTSLPETFGSPILVVQHMPEGFTKSLAERLDRLSQIKVKEAVHGESIQKGTAYIAPGGYHLGVKMDSELTVELNKEEAVFGHRPSVNYLFETLAPLRSYNIITVVMTGMGADGTEGLINLKRQSSRVYTIAEDEHSCVVYGMPKSVVVSGLADEVTPLKEIAKRIYETTNR